MNLYYDDDYHLEGFDTTRKARWIRDSLLANQVPGVTIVSPPKIDEGLIQSVHSQDYINAIKQGAAPKSPHAPGLTWSPGLWKSVYASTSGIIAAVDESLRSGSSGSLSSGIHHARHSVGAGFCSINGIIVAADYLHDALGIENVLALDFDAHFGGGTNSLLRLFFKKRPYVHHVDISVSPYDAYEDESDLPLRKHLLVEDPDLYLYALEKHLRMAEDSGIRFGACLYNAGMDPHEDCTTGGLYGINDEMLRTREEMVFDWCKKRGLPIAFVLAGGYIGSAMTVPHLVDLHRMTIEAAAR